MAQVTLNVEGMSCNHCVNAVQTAVKNAGGSARVDLASKTVEVEFDESKATLKAIKDAIEDQGYDVV
ncbi:copper ion binding protein [Paenibacillus enshidis]|uniref:Copper ion binding protein n=1 Tax=Paenibacillus enshidis TaxID=1458439 RepID=A0ABV5B0J8_9BACL